MVSRSSTLIVFRLRNSTTRMGRAQSPTLPQPPCGSTPEGRCVATCRFPERSHASSDVARVLGLAVPCYCQSWQMILYRPPDRQPIRDDGQSGSVCASGKARALRTAASRRDDSVHAWISLARPSVLSYSTKKGVYSSYTLTMSPRRWGEPQPFVQWTNTVRRTPRQDGRAGVYIVTRIAPGKA
jgi:hypothetical protein